MMETRQLTCAERVQGYYNDTFETIRRMLQGIDEDGSKRDSFELLNEYGLGIDYVQAGTFEDQEEGYIRWQLSWGGPSDEFRFYCVRDRLGNRKPYKIEYWFLDWFDGAKKLILKGPDWDTILECWDMLLMYEIDQIDYEEF